MLPVEPDGRRQARANATKGLYDGVGGAAPAPKVRAAELAAQLDAAEAQSGRWLQVEVLTPQIAALRRSSQRAKRPQIAARKRDKESQVASPIWANG